MLSCGAWMTRIIVNAPRNENGARVVEEGMPCRRGACVIGRRGSTGLATLLATTRIDKEGLAGPTLTHGFCPTHEHVFLPPLMSAETKPRFNRCAVILNAVSITGCLCSCRP